MNPKVKAALTAVLLFSAGCVVFFALNLFCDSLWAGRLVKPSPTGEYALEQRYTGFLTAGYRGRTYLVANGTCYKVDDVGPGGVEWLSDDMFCVSYYGYEHTYSVFDFIPPS